MKKVRTLKRASRRLVKKKTRYKHQTRGKSIDLLIFAAVIVLCLFGLLMIFEASSVSAFRDFNDEFYYIREQLASFLIGIVLVLFICRFNYRYLFYLALPLLLITILFLILVFFPVIGIKALGAHRWIRLGLINFQPAELAKITLTIYLAAWFSEREKSRFFAFIFLISLVLGLVVIEPDLGTAIILFLNALVIYFASGASLAHFLILFPSMVVGSFILSVISQYRFRRLLTFINPQIDPLGASYHIRQILISLATGGLFGVGIGKSRQKYQFLPEATTDSIFAIIAEEFGFVGACVVIGVFLFLLYRGFRIALKAKNRFGRLLAVGITSNIAIQTMVNLSSVSRLIPLTGVPLPFISYGGSSLVVHLVGIGILLSISRTIND